ncbi:MAG: ATP-binding protein [Gaiellaceae bacterium MAG52_C11]|nr:ATP-binding protein [Candidatus Gaiellasilicea maunaloa]
MIAPVRAKILCVDDTPENLLALEAILEPLGQELVRAASGEEALRHLLGDEFALILLDVQMPGLDGFQTADLIKQRERTRHVPIIFLTAISKDAENVFKGYESGAVDYLLKPFDSDVLRTKVAVFVELWQKTGELRRQAELLREQELAALEQASEARYRFLGDSIPQQVWTALPDGNLDYVNERVIDYFGRSFEELIGQGWNDVVHPEDLPGCLARWSSSLTSGEPYEFEFRVRGGDAWRWHLARAVAMRDENGAIVRWFGTSTDIDDRRTAEDRQRFLTEAGWVLGSSLDYERTLADVAQLAVPRVTDICTVDVLVDGRLERLALAHVDSRKALLLRELEETSLAADATEAGALAIREGRPILVSELSDEQLSTFARNERELEILRSLELRSYMSVPLLARGEVFGAITLVASSDSGRRYTENDLAVAQELARHASIAIDNARLYEQAERRGRAARVLEAIGDGVVLVDRAGIIQLWNAAATAITGLSARAVTGRPIVDVVPGWVELEPRIPVAGSPGDRVRAETIPVELGGRELWISGSGVGFDEGVVYAFRDLTEERALEELKAEFVATVSHELRTPLAAIYGSAQTIRRTDIDLDGEIRNELLGVIATESDRLAAIVNDLLLASHLDSGRLPVSIERCDALEVATAVVDTARVHAPESIELALQAPKRLAPVAADRGQLQQVLVNLVDNAIKYSPDGGTVALRIGRADAQIRFAVADHGLGIPASEHRRIFEKFYRLDPDMTRGIGGTGLGLYICRELVRRMDGSIWVESQPGKGSTFVVELPAAEPTKPSSPARQRPARNSAQSR